MHASCTERCTVLQPHVVRFKECFLTEKYLAIAMEYAAGGDMYRYVIQKCALPAEQLTSLAPSILL